MCFLHAYTFNIVPILHPSKNVVNRYFSTLFKRDYLRETYVKRMGNLRYEEGPNPKAASKKDGDFSIFFMLYKQKRLFFDPLKNHTLVLLEKRNG